MTNQKKKRHILTATLAVAMLSAILINWYYTKDTAQKTAGNDVLSSNLGDSIYVSGTTDESSQDVDEEVKSVAKTKEYFAKAQLKRTQIHDEALDKIEEILKDANKTDEAESLMKEYTEKVKLETDIENLITAKTGAECLAIINSDKAEIVVDAEAIDELYLLQITDIVSTQSKIEAENITIIQAK